MKSVAPWLRLSLLAAVCITLAAVLQPRAAQWGERAQSDSMLTMFLGEGRRLFANHFFIQADVTLHSGYYPSIFDQARRNQKQTALTGEDVHDHDNDAEPGHVHDETCNHGHGDDHDPDEAEHVHTAACNHESEHEKEMAFLSQPLDWIERFGRKFLITDHTHLKKGEEREILPWLRISAELDPQRIETYTVAAYWLRTQLGKPDEAEQFLREGLRANPNNPEILFELGRLYRDSRQDDSRARNVWELALRRWREKNVNVKEVPETELFLLQEITVNLGRLEEQSGNYEKAIGYLEIGKRLSPNPDALQKQIDEIRIKLPAK